MKIIWSPIAIRRVLEVIEYIARDRPKAAAKWADGVFAAAEKLERFPKRGPMVPELRRESHREIRYGKYRIIYRLDRDVVVILTVRHGARLLDQDEIDRQ